MALWGNYIHRLMRLRPSLLLAVVTLLFLPSGLIGLISDDLFHFILLASDFDLKINSPISPWGLFSFVSLGDEHRQVLQSFSMLDWWLSDDFVWQFWRPLSEFSHALDYFLWPGLPELMHAHNIVLFLLLLMIFSVVLKQLGMAKQVAELTLIVFAFNGSHALTVAWIANRNALLAMIFALMALGFHHRSLEDKRFYIASLVSVSACLLSGEIGLSVGGLLFAYATCLDRRVKLTAFVALLPYLLPVALWMCVYVDHQMGLKGSSWNYIEPLQFPLEYLKALMLRLPVIVSSQLLAVPAELFAFNAVLSYTAAFFGSVILCFCLRCHAYRVELRFFLLVTIVCCLPICVYSPEDRNLLFVSIGGSGIVACLILHLMNGNRVSVFVASTLICLHLILSPLLIPLATYAPKLLLQASVKQAQAMTELKFSANDRVYLLGGTERFYLLPRMISEGIAAPYNLLTLIPEGTQIEVLNVSERTLSIRLSKPFLQYLQGQDLTLHPLKVFIRDQKFKLSGVLVNIMKLDESGYPAELSLLFDKPLVELIFVAWRGGQPYRVILVRGLRIDT